MHHQDTPWGVIALHDPWLVYMAAIPALCAAYAALSLSIHARAASGGTRLLWLAAIALVSGSGIWTTHFVAMLGYEPGMPFGFALGFTTLSFALSVLLAGGGFALAIGTGRRAAGGAVVGVAIAVMHYTGMLGLRVPAAITWDHLLVLASLTGGIGLAAAALAIGLRDYHTRHVIAGTLLLTVAIGVLHYTAMAAMGLEPHPFVETDPEQVIQPKVVASVAATLALLIAVLALAGKTLDLRLARRKAKDAAELQRHVTELEATRRVLELRRGELSHALETQSAILNALPGNIALIDTDGTIVAVNESWQRFGVENGLAYSNYGIGQNYIAITLKGEEPLRERAAEAVGAIRSVLAGTCYHAMLEYPCHGPDSQRWFQMHVSPVGAWASKGAVVMHIDVTEKVLAERRVEASEERLRAIVENSGDAILTLDGGGQVLSANGTAETYFGQGAGSLVGRHIHGLIPNLPFFHPDAAPASDIPPSHGGEYLGNRGDGSRFPAEIVMSAVTLSDVAFTVLTVRDTSDQRAMQEQLVQASRLATLGEMAAGMAHELNQPLSVMRMAADNALMRIERDVASIPYLAEALELISDQTGKMGSTILNLRIFARRESDADSCLFSPEVAVSAACQLLRGKFQLDSIDIELDITASSRMVRGSGNQLEQVVINLLSNARDAILENRKRTARDGDGSSERDRVRLSIREHGTDPVAVVVTAADTGGGIPPEVHSKIFNPFFTTKPLGQGTGLGLSISYGIVRSMGGTIEARNVAGGACFTITLPTADDTSDADADASVPALA